MGLILTSTKFHTSVKENGRDNTGFVEKTRAKLAVKSSLGGDQDLKDQVVHMSKAY